MAIYIEVAKGSQLGPVEGKVDLKIDWGKRTYLFKVTIPRQELYIETGTVTISGVFEVSGDNNGYAIWR
jgi:hypothetical protein